jgi:hypothetical protein
MIKLASVGRVIAGTALVGSSLAVVDAGAAHAAIDCTQAFPDKDPDSLLVTLQPAAYHTGPGGECLTKAMRSGVADIYCAKFNARGQLWYYARHLDSGTIGWVWGGNVDGTRSRPHERC